MRYEAMHDIEVFVAETSKLNALSPKVRATLGIHGDAEEMICQRWTIPEGATIDRDTLEFLWDTISCRAALGQDASSKLQNKMCAVIDCIYCLDIWAAMNFTEVD